MPTETQAKSLPLTVQALIEAGCHFGHRTARWNPAMAKFIHGKKNQIHIIDLRQTVRGIVRAKNFLEQLCSKGGKVVFVGTKKAAREVTREQAERCQASYVAERWLGGMLTNFNTIRRRLRRLEDLDQLWTTGEIDRYSKKMVATLTREREKIARNLTGIRAMDRTPDAIVVIDPRRERSAVLEANRLSIPIIGIIDTDSDPNEVDIPIPANDDATRSVEIVLSQLADAVDAGYKSFNITHPGQLSSQTISDDKSIISAPRPRRDRRGGGGGPDTGDRRRNPAAYRAPATPSGPKARPATAKTDEAAPDLPDPASPPEVAEATRKEEGGEE
jgi:small subunit ribosomal protein S2